VRKSWGEKKKKNLGNKKTALYRQKWETKTLRGKKATQRGLRGKPRDVAGQEKKERKFRKAERYRRKTLSKRGGGNQWQHAKERPNHRVLYRKGRKSGERKGVTKI